MRGSVRSAETKRKDMDVGRFGSGEFGLAGEKLRENL